MAEGRQPEISFPARAEAAAGGVDHVAFVDGFVEERKYHVSARRNSINKPTKSQLTITLTPPSLSHTALSQKHISHRGTKTRRKSKPRAFDVYP